MKDRNAGLGLSKSVSGHRTYLILAAAAFVAGTFFRFWDLGGAPLAVDEYFFGTSILNIADRGVPAFPCGGFYTRGVLIQYLSVPLLAFGGSLEFATRFWPAVASLLSIVVIWRIGRLAGGVKTAAIAVVLVSLSVWEIEFARFGRMYSPFQAVFLWYVYLQILHLTQGNNKAYWWYLALSGISIFVYAGAAFLLVFNFLALIWPGKRWTFVQIVVAVVLLVFGMGMYSGDFRYLGIAPEAAPPRIGTESGPSLPVNIPVLPELSMPILVLGLFVVGYLVLRYKSYVRGFQPSIIYWALAALATSFGLFGFGLGFIFAGLLLRVPSPLVGTGLNAINPGRVLFGLFTLWLVVLTGLFALDGGSLWDSVKNALRYLIGYPDLYYSIVRPWFQTIPVTAAILLLLVVLQLWILLVRERNGQSQELTVRRYIAGSVILMMMLTAILSQPYAITRYTYFLYPLILVLSSAAIVHWSRLLFISSRMRTGVSIIAVTLLFALAEDFRLDHLVRINEPEFRFRTVYNDRLAGHYYPRWDFRSAAYFVNERLAPSDNVIVFDQPLPHYLNRTSGIFIREGTKNHSLVWGCGGTRDLWSDAPLLDTEKELRDLIEHTNGSVWLIVRTSAYQSRDPLESLLPEQYGLEAEYLTLDGHLAVYRLPPRASIERHGRSQASFRAVALAEVASEAG